MTLRSLTVLFSLALLPAPSIVGGQGPAAGTGFALTADQMRSDIAAFRTGFFSRDNSYAPAARVAAESRLRQLDASLATTTPIACDLGRRAAPSRCPTRGS